MGTLQINILLGKRYSPFMCINDNIRNFWDAALLIKYVLPIFFNKKGCLHTNNPRPPQLPPAEGMQI